MFVMYKTALNVKLIFVSLCMQHRWWMQSIDEVRADCYEAIFIHVTEFDL
jgi:hypothetical protein